MAGVVRSSGGVGFVSANGGFVTKHAFGVYSSSPPAAGFRWEKPQAEIDASFTPTPIADVSYSGPVTVEAYTVMHDRDGEPELGIVAVRTPAGERSWGTTRESAVLPTLLREGAAGAAASIAEDGSLAL
jgi:acetyl-CoA C-acetyltransferase